MGERRRADEYAESLNPLPPITERTFSVVSDLMDREGLQDRDPHTISLFVENLVARERFFRTVDGSGSLISTPMIWIA